METVQTTYGERLKRARLNAGLSQAELARRLGLKAQAVQYLEEPANAAQGSKSTPGFARELGVDAVWLANGSGEMRPPGGVREPPAPYAAAPDLAKSIRSLTPELQRAIGVLVRALMHAPATRTFELNTKANPRALQKSVARRRRA